MRIKWKDHYSMGIEALDDDHKRLFKIAGKIIDTIEDSRGMDEKARLFVVREGVKYLKNYFAEHALREEAYMREIGYSDYVAHKRLHDEFQTVQIAKFEKVIECGICTRDEAFAFVGVGIGWLLEHVSTADMAIVGKGVLCYPSEKKVDQQVLEQEINRMFAATLNIDAQAKVINGDYGGEYFGEAVYQSIIYSKNGKKVTVFAGIEKSFLIGISKLIYGELEDSDALLLSMFEIFGANFWRTLGERLIKQEGDVKYLEGHFLARKQVEEVFTKRLPVVSVLFDSNRGKFFVCSDDESWLEARNVG